MINRSSRSAVFVWLILSTMSLVSCIPEKNTLSAVFVDGQIFEAAPITHTPNIVLFPAIPYAAPPINALRWQPPQPVVRDNKRTSTRHFAPACVQGSYNTDWYKKLSQRFAPNETHHIAPIGESEDCLYLNVWAPADLHKKSLPVMVFVHGGSNRGGWSYEPNYLGEQLAQKNVVVVSVAYRLGIFGFYAKPQSQHDDLQLGDPQRIKPEALINYGLLDIEQAFHWVQKHIAHFGGDPNNITAFGESAGAGNIVDLLTKLGPSQKLIRRTILQSMAGSLTREPLAGKGYPFSEYDAQRLLSSRPQSHWRGLSSDKLHALTQHLPSDFYFEAQIHPESFPHAPKTALKEGLWPALDLMIGTNKNEWLMYLNEDVSDAEVSQWITQNTNGSANDVSNLLTSHESARQHLDRLETAKYMLCPARYIAARNAKIGGRSYRYYFTRQRAGDGGKALGAYHGAELPYVFNQHDSWLPTTKEDKALTAEIMDYWVSFAASGDPNGKQQPHWPTYRTDNPLVLILDSQIKTSPLIDDQLCALIKTEGK